MTTTATQPTPLQALRAADHQLPFIPAQVNRTAEYWNLAGMEGPNPYRTAMREVDAMIGKLKRLRAHLQELETHEHDWNEDDYCQICRADGRA